MAQTRFTGPVVSDNGFIGDVTGDITGNITGDVVGDVTGNVAGVVTSTTSTSALLGDIGDAVNTAGKALGTTLYNTTTKTFYVAQGATAGSTWIDAADGTTTITPS